VARLNRSRKHLLDSCCVLAKDMGVNPERDRWIGMPETFGNHMDRHASQEEMRGMNMSQVVQSR